MYTRLTKVLLVSLHRFLIGRIAITSSLTDHSFHRDFILRQPHETKPGIVLRMFCFRVTHKAKSSRWYMWDRTFTTYKVEAYYTVGKKIVSLPTAHYPQVTPNWMESTEYPFHIAITNYVDSVLNDAAGPYAYVEAEID